MTVNYPVIQIIIPCYNPDPGWEKIVLDKFQELQQSLPAFKIRLAIVNDGSSLNVLESHISYLKSNSPDLEWLGYPENKGKGNALRFGVERLQADFYIYTDIDFPYTLKSMIDISQSLLKGADVAIGIRDENYYNLLPIRRVFISRIVKKMIRFLLKTDISDTQCGLKGFNNNGREYFLKTTIKRYLFDMQFVQIVSGVPDLIVKPITVYARQGISFTHMTNTILLKESFNFIRLILLPEKNK